MSSESFYHQELPPLTRSTTTHGRHHSSPHIYYAKPNTISPEWTTGSAKRLPSFVNLLTHSEQDWLHHHHNKDCIVSQSDPNTSYPPPPVLPPKQSHRRAIQTASPVKKSPLSIHKSKSMREHSKKLHSPPPPVPSDQPPQLPEKRSIMPFVHKIKRKLSLSSTNHTNAYPKPRRSVSSSALAASRRKQSNSPPPLPQSTVSSAHGLADYQGYVNQKKHRSFTYSPPPPPRTSSLAASSVPAVPPLPSAPKLQQMNTRTSSLKQMATAPVRKSSLKKSSDNTTCLHRKLSTAEYAKNISHDLALIEKDIRALEIQRDKHSNLLVAAETKAKQLKDGKAEENPQEKSKQEEEANQTLENKQTTLGRKRGKVIIKKKREREKEKEIDLVFI